MRRWILIVGVLGGCDDSASVDKHDSDSTSPSTDTDTVAAVQCASPTVPHGLRRLTRFQYDRATSDLLGEDWALAQDFPLEVGSWEGTSDAQAVAPNLVDSWWGASEALSTRPFAHDATVLEVESLGLADGMAVPIPGDPGGWWSVSVVDRTVSLPIPLQVAEAGRYRVTLRGVWTVGFDKGNPPPALAWRVGRTVTSVASITGHFDAPEEIAADLDLTGPTTASLELSPAVQVFQAVALDRVTIEGPIQGPWIGEGASHRKWIDCSLDSADLSGCAAQILTRFADTAWRRPPSDEEIASLTEIVQGVIDEGDDVEVGMALAFRAVLFAPSFLFREEDVSNMRAGDVRAATPDELATRLAFLLWGSLPDDTLRACAASGKLDADRLSADPCGLPAQVDRLLASPRSDALVRDFGRQWLGVDAAASFVRDPSRYPQMDADLATSMAEGAYGTLTEARRSGVDMRELIDASWAWGDARLAAIYGVDAPASGAGRLTLTGDRRGLLGSAFVLASTSHADRPSPVLRGRWVLDRLLCEPPGNPPAGVPALPADATSGDVRAMLEAHRQDPACSFCHARIDPLGLPLEGFDAIGAARTTYEDGAPIDLHATLDSDVEVNGLADLAHALRADPRVPRCLIQHAATWTWERFPTPQDAETLADVEAGAAADGFTLDAVIRALAMSDQTVCVTAPQDTP